VPRSIDEDDFNPPISFEFKPEKQNKFRKLTDTMAGTYREKQKSLIDPDE
jgi:hypothetical protein